MKVLKKFSSWIALVAVSTLTVPAAAQLTSAANTSAALPADIKTGKTLYSSDGKRIGKINRVNLDNEKNPVSVSIISESRFLTVPTASISQDGERLVTSLSRKDVAR